MRIEEYQRLYEVEQRHFWFRGTRGVVLDQLAPALAGPLDVLDVGCGTGGTRERMPASWRYTGVDLSPEALAFSRARGEPHLVRASVEQLPFPEARFDAVLALDVLEHCDDDGAAAAELARVLRPGGRLVLTVPAFQALWSEHDEALHHRRRYRRAGLRRVLEGAGLRLERLTYFNTFLFPAAALVRLTRRALPRRGPPRSDARLPPAPLNAALTGVFEAERRLLRRVSLPFGLSLLAVARR